MAEKVGGGRASGWYSSSVAVRYITNLTLKRWLEEHKLLANNPRNF